MVSIKDLPKIDQEYYLDNEIIKYNPLCESCARSCKMSFKSKVVMCNRIPVKTKEEYLKEIEKQDLAINELAHKININGRTLSSLLNNINKDIPYEVHSKLMNELFNINI